MINREKLKAIFPFLAEIIRWAKRRKNELPAIKRHLARKRFQKNNLRINKGKIKVVFICQYIPAWSKNKQLYETLKKDKRFDLLLLCIPDRISSNKLLDPDNLTNDTFDYFSGHGYQESINALLGKDQWLDLKSLHPDYVIYNRYDRPMPTPYTSAAVSTYAKICLISYGLALHRAGEFMFDKRFAANTYCLFSESEEKRNEFIRWNRILCGLKLSKAVCCGITGVENALKSKLDKTSAWDFSTNNFRAIYAPRWTQDSIWGGSSFLKYKEAFLKIADEFSNMDILLRPRPLMFGNFINTGVMTENEVTEYKRECELRSNLSLDSEKEYHATFWNSSVLICDYTSMIIEYYVTGNPIIFLTYDENIVYTDLMYDMLSGCYIVHDENELRDVLGDLICGVDPLAEKRKAVIENKLTGNDNYNASGNMKRILLQGYHE